MEKHFMIDIETSGTDKEKDEILEVGLVEIERTGPKGLWCLTGKDYHRVLHSPLKPTRPFQMEHQQDLFKRCNEQSPEINYALVKEEVGLFLHGPDYKDDLVKHMTPKFFMGWNASNFDVPFMAAKDLLTLSYYVTEGGKESLKGDAHYRVYEQTGALQLLCDSTGFSRDLIQKICEEMNPTNLVLPKGKVHDALYDCYKQIIMMNGLIELSRRGWRK